MNETMIYSSTYREELEEVMGACARPTHYAFIKGAEGGLPEGLAIEVGHSGKTFTPKSYRKGEAYGYFPFYTRELAKAVRKGCNSFEEVRFASFEEAKAFIEQVVAFIEWMGGIAAPTQGREPELSNRRATALGIVYTADGRYTTLVTANGSACNCGKDEQGVVCEHRRAALAQEKRYAEEAARRNEYCEQFGIYA